VPAFPPGSAEPLDIEPFKIFQKPLNFMKKVFISYSKSDKEYLETAKKHLKLFERQGKLKIWDDTQLIAGEVWDAAIKRELAAADIILFLVSSDLMATDYIWDIEMTTAMSRAATGQVKVVPIIIRDCTWTGAPFGRFAALPSKGIPIATAPNADAAWKEVVEKIEKIC
jgi:internalin A